MDAYDAPLPAVVLNDVNVHYRTFQERTEGSELLKRLRPREVAEVHALRGLTATINVGEAVGVIGNNGSGKSTLLQAIAGLVPISSGRIQVRGSAAMMGVGAVLKKQLSGARNVYIGGFALGLTRREIDERFDGIVAETGIGEAIHRPVKTYSSGMRARLQFAIATASVPNVLLLDEILAVGDRQFRKRSLQRLNEIREAAGTILLVTHRFKEIEATCPRTLWIREGTIAMDGPTSEILHAYEEANDQQA